MLDATAPAQVVKDPVRVGIVGTGWGIKVSRRTAAMLSLL